MLHVCRVLRRAAAPAPALWSRGEVAQAVLHGRDHGIQFGPYQVVRVLQQLTQEFGKAHPTKPGAQAWTPACDEALQWLCEVVATEACAGRATGEDCAAILKRLSIANKKLSKRVKNAAFEAVLLRVKQPPVLTRVHAHTAVDILTALARSFLKERALCVDLLRQMFPSLAAAADDPEAAAALRTALEKLYIGNFSNLLYALPRHGVDVSHPIGAALEPSVADVIPKVLREGRRSGGLRWSNVARLLEGAMGFGVSETAMREVCHLCAEALAEPHLAQAVTEWEARAVSGCFARYAVTPAAPVLTSALKRERPHLKHDLAFGMALDWIEVAEDMPLPGRVACRELRVLTQRATWGGKEAVDQKEVDELLAVVGRPELLQTLRGEEVYYLLHSLARLGRARDHNLLERVAERALAADVLSGIEYAQHVVGVMTSVAALAPLQWPKRGRSAMDIMERYAQKLLAPEMKFSRVEYQCTGAMWAIAMARGSSGLLQEVLAAALAKVQGDVQDYSARLLTPVLWSAAKVRLTRCEAVAALAARFEAPEVRGQLTVKMLGLTLYSVARLSLRRETELLYEEAVLQRVADKGDPKVISMSLYAVQLTGILHKPLLDGLCHRLVTDPVVAAHFVARPTRPADLLRVFMSMQYQNQPYVDWVRRHVVSRAQEAQREAEGLRTFDKAKRRGAHRGSPRPPPTAAAA
eukprot:TRINITY_DN16695_c0_g1_i1.p1 TRINITY_DN16695_c0_g1~~TRINITY_DN16695_c0_g1_i1.p1  ORF type:complete len:696 (+),score=204.94 TRINITY_DN16695_c0_g1_i1:61-2148(+)